MFAPGNIRCQEQRDCSVKERILRPIDRNATKAAVEIITRTLQRISGTVEVEKNSFSVDEIGFVHFSAVPYLSESSPALSCVFNN